MVSILRNCFYKFLRKFSKARWKNGATIITPGKQGCLLCPCQEGSSNQQLRDVTCYGCQGLNLEESLFVICTRGKVLGTRAPSCPHLLLWSGTLFVPFTLWKLVPPPTPATPARSVTSSQPSCASTSKEFLPLDSALKHSN